MPPLFRRGCRAALALSFLALCSLGRSTEVGFSRAIESRSRSSSIGGGSIDVDVDLSPKTSTSTSSWPFGPAKRVDVTLYGEAKCPFCAKWITQNALRLVSELGSIVDFRVVEWGNSRRNSTTGDVTCQHGPSECFANALFECARDELESGEDPYRALRVVACSEKDVFEKAADPSDRFDACVVEEAERGSPSPSGDDEDDREKAGRELARKIRACAEGERGTELVAEAERATSSLDPPHTFVPWIVVDGIPVGDAPLETVRAVACAAWRGKERPEACREAPGLGTSFSPSSVF